MRRQLIVRTCRKVRDTSPPSLPAIPKGTYGICDSDTELDYPPVDFGPPWGVQEVSNADLLDAAAVLENAKRAILHVGRPWSSVIRRTLRSFARPYLVTAAGRFGFHGRFAVEAYLDHHDHRDASLDLLNDAIELTGQRGSRKAAS